MKKLFASLLFFFNFISIFAHNGMMTGEKDIKVVSTQWFDIIYAPSSEHTAALLYENADNIYKEIADMYGRKIIYRMPVVITSNVEQFNAYFSNGLYNHIVLYDTYQIDELSVFSETMLSTFRHELTHAYTMNLSDFFWRGIKSVFGDAISPIGLNITSGWAEGATLTSESVHGEGRLNDEYAKKTVIQAKLENKFPCYGRVQGESDVYPVGSYYFFNGAFNKYLQDKYGMEKYSKFWYEAVNCHHIFTGHVFKTVYKKNLNKEWKVFAKEYEVPEIPGNPVAANLVQDFFNKDKSTYSSLNNAGYIFSSLSKSQKGLTFIDSYNSDAVFFVPAEKLDDTKIKPKKLFTLSGLTSAVQSSDGRFIALIYTTNSGATIQSKSAVYDTLNKKIIKFGERGCGESSVIVFNGEYYLIETHFKSQFYKFQISKLSENGNKGAEICTVEFPYEVFPNSITDLGDGTFAYLKKEKLNWSICVSDLNGNLLKEYKAPYERMVMRNLSFDDGNIYFSYAKPGKMPDLGKLNISDNLYSFRSDDISGGVYYPLANGDSLIYSGSFYKMNRILTMKPEFSESVPAEINEPNILENESSLDELPALDGKKYNSFKFYKRGLFLPFSDVVSYGILNDTSVILPLGFTYMTRNPWDGNTIALSMGYGLSTNSFAAKLGYDGGTHTSLFNYSLAGQFEVDGKGLKTGYFAGSASSVFPFGNISKFVVSVSALEKIGRENYVNTENADTEVPVSQLIGIYAPLDNTIYFTNLNSLKLYYTNIHGTGPGRYEKFGVKAGTEVYYNLRTEFNNNEIFLNAGNLGAFAEFYIPRLIPIDCVNGFEYNLPAKLCAAVYPSPNVLSDFSVSYADSEGSYLNGLLCYGETVLFNAEIQHPLLLTKLIFFKQFSLSATCLLGYELPEKGYTGSWNFLKTADFVNQIASKKVDLFVCPGIKATLGSTPKLLHTTYNAFIAVNFVKNGDVLEPKCNIGLNSSF